MREDPRARQGGEGRPDRPERPDHAVARRDGARGARDGAPGLQAAAAHRRRDDQPRAHRGQDRAALQRAGRARARRQPRGAGDDQPAQRRGQAGVRRAAPRRVRDAAQDARARRKQQARAARGGARAAARRSSGAPRTCRRPSSPACACSTTFRSRRCASTSTGRRSSTPGSSRASTRASSSTRSTASRRGRSSPRPTRCSTRSSSRSCSRARGVYGFFPANAVGDDVELYTDATRTQVLDALPLPAPADRRRTSGEPCRSLADFIAPKETGPAPITSARFAVTTGIGLKELCDSFRAEHDDYNAIMAEALADRLAEAFAECLHKRVRDEWGYGRDENLTHRRADPREVPRHPPGRRLSRLPRPHREGHALAAARRRGEHRHAAHRVVRDVARLERERPLLRAPRVALLQRSARSTATRSPTTTRARA